MSYSHEQHELDLFAVGVDDSEYGVESLNEGIALNTWTTSSTASSGGCPVSSALSISTATSVS